MLSQAPKNQPEVATCALLLFSILRMFGGQFAMSSVFFALACLTNLTMLIFLPAFLGFFWITSNRSIRDSGTLLAAVFFTVGAWLCLYSFLHGPSFDFDPLQIDSSWRQGSDAVLARLFFFKPLQVFAADGRWIMSSALVLCVLFILTQSQGLNRTHKLADYKRELFLLLLIVSQVLFLCFFGLDHSRYFLISIVLTFLLFGRMSFVFPPKFNAAILILHAVFAIHAWRGDETYYSYSEYRLQDSDEIKVLQLSCQKMQELAHQIKLNPVILANWPLSEMGNRPFLGYRCLEKLDPVWISTDRLAEGELFSLVQKSSDRATFVVHSASTRALPTSRPDNRLGALEKVLSGSCTTLSYGVWSSKVCLIIP